MLLLQGNCGFVTSSVPSLIGCLQPPATIGLPQETASYNGDAAILESRGRHDPCVVPRAIPIVEAMAALVLVDAALAQLARDASSKGFERLCDIK